MYKSELNKKGVVLLITLSTLLLVVILSNVIISIVLSQSRLTRHQTGRIEAYYTARAGINYTLDRMMAGVWVPPVAGTITRTICPGPVGCDVNNSGLPYTVTVTIYSAGANPPGPAPAIPAVAPIRTTVNYPTP